MGALQQWLKLSRGGRSSVKVAPYLAGSSMSQRRASLCPSHSPGNSSARKPCVVNTNIPHLQLAVAWALSIPSRPDARTWMCSGMWLGRSAPFGDHSGSDLLPRDSPIPHVPLLMWGWKDYHSTGATPRTTSAPFERDALPSLDLGAISPSTTIATSCKAAVG